MKKYEIEHIGISEIRLDFNKDGKDEIKCEMVSFLTGTGAFDVSAGFGVPVSSIAGSLSK
jgi:hypothetical protein